MDSIQKFIQYLENEKNRCMADAVALARDDRGDEAGLAKARGNIFGVVASVCGVSEKQTAMEPIAFIKDRIHTIPEAWVASLAAAEQHNDREKAAVERLKLETMSEISKALADILEGAK